MWFCISEPLTLIQRKCRCLGRVDFKDKGLQEWSLQDCSQTEAVAQAVLLRPNYMAIST